MPAVRANARLQAGINPKRQADNRWSPKSIAPCCTPPIITPHQLTWTSVGFMTRAFPQRTVAPVVLLPLRVHLPSLAVESNCTAGGFPEGAVHALGAHWPCGGRPRPRCCSALPLGPHLHEILLS